MKNLNYLNTNEIAEFNLIKNSKANDTKNRLNAIQPRVLADYNNYLNNFATIHQIGPSTYSVQDGNDLRGCYAIKTIARDSLLSRIVNIQSTHFKFICPYCLLFPRTTYDHYVPEGAYPEFSVLAKNLIPCCITCNGKKLGYWRANGSRKIIHYYNDLLPQTQFLFGTLSFNAGNVPTISFAIHQPNGVSNQLYSIIEGHFERLNLCDRYSEHIDLIVSEIIDDVTVNRLEFGNALTTQSIANIITNRSAKLRQHYGINYWKSISMDLLANSPQFINSL